jgi:hypothetical protein
MGINLNDAKVMSKEEISTITVDLYKKAKEEWKSVHFGTAYKIYEEWMQKMELDIKKHINNVELSDLNKNFTKEKIRQIKSRKDTDCRFSRRKVTYDAFEGKMYGLCTMQDILELINGKALDCFEKLTKDNYSAVNNMIREQKGRKNEEGNEVGRYMAFNAKKELICTTKDKRIQKRISYANFSW